MRKIIFAAICFLFFGHLSFGETPAVLEKATALMSGQQYDAAVRLLEEYVSTNSGSADGYLLLGQAYHWKKEMEKAKGYYFKAAELDSQYRLSVIPLLDELKEWEKIIEIVEPEIRAGNQYGPSLLGALATAYRQLGQEKSAGDIISALRETTYDVQEDKDYKNYILAYAALWNGDRQGAKTRLKQIKDPSYRRYARTHEKFRELFDDPEFVEITR